ncbi:MAG: SAM-dependent chlorinase/fluorinase [Bdellovibrionales bacterium]|jgi:S-adenosylmethionine hydrolase|nr:SAM-dependent chlorinase/fluorinase [Bdellovibrionales bacterium]
MIAFITDFSDRDPFAGIMKGVVAKINPEIKVIDISHGLDSFNIRQAKFVIKNCFGHFPKGTVFCVVVDPGVGSSRKAIAIKTSDYYFVGPDNGIFGPVYEAYPDCEVREISNPLIMNENISQTFHGRDIFAPASAHLANGLKFEDVGNTFKNYLFSGEVKPETNVHGIKGEIDYIDSFGNAISNISHELIKDPSNCLFKIGDHEAQFVRYYAEGEKEKLSCLISSGGLLEFFVLNNNASEKYKIHFGDEVLISFC